MALFFDQQWFDDRLQATGLTRDDVAAALGLSRPEVDEIWKDQREVTPNQVAMLARLLGAPAAEIVNRAGVATPSPSQPPAGDAALASRLADIDARLTRIERAIADLQSLVLATRGN
ncbi:MAG: helix-turn-helix transcriptional regulator [Parvibaculum sp.]|nr:helix-turn-helix transcriptional regulator [Parvibaculum sp.]